MFIETIVYVKLLLYEIHMYFQIFLYEKKKLENGITFHKKETKTSFVIYLGKIGSLRDKWKKFYLRFIDSNVKNINHNYIKCKNY